jgi:uncharacterized membrane protein YkvA (DUF1232 family)
MANREPLIIDAVPERVSSEDARASASQARGQQTTSNASTAGSAAAAQRATWKRVAIGVLALLYVLSPLDLIPDWFPVIGWLDDLGVLAWAARQVFFKK